MQTLELSLKTFLLQSTGFECVFQIYKVFFFLLISSSFLLITHSLFGDHEIAICFACLVWLVMYLDSSKPLCTPLLLCVYTLLQLSLNFHRSQACGPGQVVWNENKKIPNIFKILIVHRPAFSFLIWVRICRKVKVILSIHNNSFMTCSGHHSF